MSPVANDGLGKENSCSSGNRLGIDLSRKLSDESMTMPPSKRFLPDEDKMLMNSMQIGLPSTNIKIASNKG
jgi:hypothetical protein